MSKDNDALLNYLSSQVYLEENKNKEKKIILKK